MTKEDYFYEAFQGMERLGPGSRESTEKALAFFPRKSQPVRILDVGCGVGTHTFLLASHFPKAATALISKRLTRAPLPAASPIGFTVWRCPCLI